MSAVESARTSATLRHPGALRGAGGVVLRALTDADVPALVEHCNDATMVRFTKVPHPYTALDGQAYVAAARRSWQEGGRYVFAVAADGRFAGTVELTPLTPRRVALSFSLVRALRGRGIMATGVRLALGWIFDRLDVEFVEWRAVAGNWSSRRVVWATGFLFEGRLRGVVEYRGGARDGWIATLRRGERMAPRHPWFVPRVLQIAPLPGRGPRAKKQLLTLRPHRDEDVDRMVEGFADPETQRWLPHISPGFTAHDAESYIEHQRDQQAQGTGITWVIADADDRFQGEIALFDIASLAASASIGYWVHPEARGYGIATASVRRVVRHALSPIGSGGFGLARLALTAAAENTASLRVAERAGFTRTGTDRRAELLRDGTWCDLVRFDLLIGEVGR